MFFITAPYSRHRWSEVTGANVPYCFQCVSFFFFLHSPLYLYLFERLNRLSAVFMAYGIAALRGLHHPLTINEMWHANLWLEAQVMINALIHKLPSWFTANHPYRCTGHHCLVICISGKIVWNKLDIQQSDIYNPAVCMRATHQTTCKNV